MAKKGKIDMSQEQIDELVLDTIKFHCADTIYFKDRESRFLWNSQQHADQFGVKSPQEMVGKTDYDYFPEEFADKALEVERQIIETGEPMLNVEEEWEKDDETRYLLASKYPFRNKEGEIIGTWGITRDITELRHLEKELERSYMKVQRLARVDDVTGLYNRRYFYENLERVCSIYDRREDEISFSLIAIDVDNMKFINDQYGQQKGDDVLRHVASSMLNAIRKSDICFRTGGDEFAVLLPDCDKQAAVGVAKSITKNVSDQAVPLGESKFEKITISIGVATYVQGTDISEIISAADRKLYKAKRNGKNQLAY
ncbi:MAG: GGDEF domain-containing protein [Clostridiales bacterium]|nr:GGDEF domain-containing protein [Clostridiales bacterium]